MSRRSRYRAGVTHAYPGRRFASLLSGLVLLGFLASSMTAAPARAAGTIIAMPVMSSFAADGTFDLLVSYDRPGFTARTINSQPEGACVTTTTSCTVQGIYSSFQVVLENDEAYQDRPVLLYLVRPMDSLPGPVTARSATANSVTVRAPSSSVVGDTVATSWPGGQQCSDWRTVSFQSQWSECVIADLTPTQSYDVVVTRAQTRTDVHSDGRAVTEWLWAKPVSVVVAGVPGQVPNVTTSATSRSIATSWGTSDPQGATMLDYTATLSPSGQSCVVTAAATKLGCAFEGLSPATAYNLTVTGRNALGSSVPVTQAVTTSPDVPNAPTDVVASGNGSSVATGWSASAPNGRPIGAYLVQARRASDGHPAGSCSTTTTTCIIGGLAAQTSYQVSVQAQNAVGLSGPGSTTFTTWTTLKNVARPYIVGSPRAGKTLRANVGYWRPSTVDRFRFIWTLNGKPIKGASKATFRPSKKMVGKKLRVQVVADRAGYTSGRTTSTAVKVRKRR